MNIYSSLSLISFFIQLTFFLLIFFQHNHHLSKKLLFYQSFLLGFVGLSFINLNILNPDINLVIVKVKSIFWLAIGYMFLNFTCSFLKTPKPAWSYFLYIVFNIFIAISLTTKLVIKDVTLFEWGYDILPGPLFLASVLICVATPALYSCFLMFKKLLIDELPSRTKKEIRQVILATIIPLIFGIIWDAVIPVIYPSFKYIRLSSSITVIQIFFIYRVLSKNLITPLDAFNVSSFIFRNTSNAILIANQNGTIQHANKASISILKKPYSNLLNQNINHIINHPDYNSSNTYSHNHLPNSSHSISQLTVQGFDEKHLQKIIVIHKVSE